jgi:hypothetical protein
MLINAIPQYIQNITNAKADLTGTGVVTLYTAPSGAEFNSSVINSILVSEDSGNADTVTVTLTNGSDVFSLFKVAAVGANATVELLTHSLVLQGGEILKVQAATGNRLHVVASIQEYAQNRSTTAL